jgi:3'(2'), 5'-bisphosphate nucleotidase
MNKATPPRIDREAAASLIEPLTDLVIRAGRAILAVNRTTMKVDGKTDGSPVTEADLAADRIIGQGLAQLAPDIPSLSEARHRRRAGAGTDLARNRRPRRRAADAQ